MGQQHVMNIALINTERECANSVVKNGIDPIINIFACQMAETAIYFNMFYELIWYMYICIYGSFICKNIFTSYVGLC